MRLAIIFALTGCIAGCTAPNVAAVVRPVPPLPSEDEIHKFVSENWDSLGKRFAHDSGKPDASAELIGVSEVSCGYTFDVADCSYQVTGRVAGAPNVKQRMFTQFDRDEAGKLVEILVFWHERRR